MGSWSWTTTSPSSLCTCLWSTPCPVGLTSEETHAHIQVSCHRVLLAQPAGRRPTLGSDGLRDGAGVTQAIGVYGSNDEQVHRIGKKPADCVCLHSDQVCYSLPGAAGWLAGTGQRQMWLCFNQNSNEAVKQLELLWIKNPFPAATEISIISFLKSKLRKNADVLIYCITISIKTTNITKNF